MAISDFPAFNYYDVQRFLQFSPQDAANWYVVQAPSGKKKNALYPCMGRRHVNYLKQNVLIFGEEPRAIFKSIDYMYVIVGTTVYQVNDQFVAEIMVNSDFTNPTSTVWFAYLPIINDIVYCMLTDGINMYFINESEPMKVMHTVTGSNLPPAPTYIAAFGNRFVVSSANSSQFYLTQINCGAVPVTDYSILFTPAVFAQEAGLIQQMAVLHNQLYIFTNFTTGIWSNTPSSVFNSSSLEFVQFPWKKNTSYDWDYGMADPFSLDVDFGMMAWLAQNRNGLVEFMVSDGQMPQSISTQAINTLLQQGVNAGQYTPFLTQNTVGFLYQYEDSIFYRVSADFDVIDGDLLTVTSADSIEFHFDTKTWHRCIEVNGSRNLIRDHVFFASKHIVSVITQRVLYEMAGNIYINELINPAEATTDLQSPTAFLAYPFRYEFTTPIIAQDDYSEFITKFVQIDFVWGMGFIESTAPFQNTVFLISELSTEDNPVYIVAEDGETFIIAEGTNIPSLSDDTYNALFNPHVELYVSDDGGISFYSASNLEFSQLGQYNWRMRWYQLGCSRNRVYQLVAVSPTPIVVLGAIHNVERISGGAD